MNLAARKLWAVGTVTLLLGGVAIWSRLAKQEVIVQLIDANQGTACTNVAVTIVQVSRTPLISEIKFLPDWLRYHTSWRTTHVVDGRFALQRITKHSSVFRQQASCTIGSVSGPDLTYSLD